MDSTTDRNIVVVGAGYVGAPLCRALAARGHHVVGIRRGDPGSGMQGVEMKRADVTDPESLFTIWPSQVDDLVFCAARGADQGYDELYVQGMQNLLKVVQQTGRATRRVLLVSSTGVYGANQGEWIDEGTVPVPTREAGRAMLQAERILRSFPGDTLAVRCSGLYGPGRARLVRAVRLGEDRPGRTPSTWVNQIHRDDCVDVVQHLLDVPNPHPVYLATDEEPALRADVLAWLARQMKVAVPVAVAAEHAGGKRCHNRRLLDAGYRFRFPTYREGYAHVLAAGEGA